MRSALEKYKDPYVAIHDGYFSTLGCVEFERAGAAGHVPYKPGGMGVHFLNIDLIGPVPDPAKPQVLLYEPDGDKLRLVGAEWFIPLATGVKARPMLWGRPFDGPMTGHPPLLPMEMTPLRPSRVALQAEPLGDLRADQPRREVHRSPLSPGRGVAEAGSGAEARKVSATGTSSLDRIAAAGLIVGAVFGGAGTFAASPQVQASLWAIDSVGLVIAASLLTIRYLRAGAEVVAGGFLVFAIGEGILLSGTAAGPAESVPAFAAGIALWAAGLALVSTRPLLPLWLRVLGGVAACLFAVTAGRIYAGEMLLPTASPLPFFAYPFLVATLLGWAWVVLRERP